ncbi:hypothetical protein [Enterobacter hormaechei]|uniref:hypothetical protein n=1 Tax=Enterobacter hormaechei TaxID=158836 RepID=UPI0007A923E9|nr:hypothetical protein [Enterobacter hormaechei]SAI93541.1 Uncharacterised protein [Enterobacter hormaechei]
MKIEHQNSDVTSKITITSTLFEFRKHNRVVDTTLSSTLGIIAIRSGMFFMKTILSGKSRDILRAYKTAQREADR